VTVEAVAGRARRCATLRGHPAGGPRGWRSASRARDGGFTIRVGQRGQDGPAGWDYATGRELWVMRHPTAVPRGRPAPARTRKADLALLGRPPTARPALVDLDDPKKEPVVLDHRHQGAGGWRPRFSPDSKVCATAGEDRTIHLYDVETGKVPATRSARRTRPAGDGRFQFRVRPTCLVSAGRDNPPETSGDVTAGPAAQVAGRLRPPRRRGWPSSASAPTASRCWFDQGQGAARAVDQGRARSRGCCRNYGAHRQLLDDGPVSPRTARRFLTNNSSEGRLQLWRKAD